MTIPVFFYLISLQFLTILVVYIEGFRGGVSILWKPQYHLFSKLTCLFCFVPGFLQNHVLYVKLGRPFVIYYISLYIIILRIWYDTLCHATLEIYHATQYSART